MLLSLEHPSKAKAISDKAQDEGLILQGGRSTPYSSAPMVIWPQAPGYTQLIVAVDFFLLLHD